jgi:hypothetical protein
MNSSRHRWLVQSALLVTTSGCNAVLGIDAPQSASHGASAGDQGFGASVQGTSDAGVHHHQQATSDGGQPVVSELPADPHPWAEWPMPNPASTSLGTPSSYSLATPGIVNDDVTGLEWEQMPDVQARTWKEASAYCKGLALASGGFRLPSRIELISLIDYTQGKVAIDAVAFPSAPQAEYWTASPFAGVLSSVWTVNFAFGTGFVFSSDIQQVHLVRCVR